MLKSLQWKITNNHLDFLRPQHYIHTSLIIVNNISNYDFKAVKVYMIYEYCTIRIYNVLLKSMPINLI